ncbi:MAG: DUF1893 domain-containing protein [Dehalococcoidales bacterium]|nr:DUF1893 domain-containing protein [Dehalococcoidales bacterium]
MQFEKTAIIVLNIIKTIDFVLIMMTELIEKAKGILEEGRYTCVICSDRETITSTTRGVKPLTDLLDAGRDVRGMSAADNVIGRGAAFLYALLGVKEVYGKIISQPAAEVLESNGIRYEYGELVKNIINREGTGLCPMEEATLTATDPKDAFERIKRKQEELRNKNGNRS